eukprot:TRINITY_DN5956_c0_g1_i5.p1 TRINITY_DN5956_c0_g1~~TRINITY_DN5956_c0_g1_i5.p1  ORF type:complete len:215 (-),score=76.53 TRINITY_DN5956_c0_g1_i5:283-927(-)
MNVYEYPNPTAAHNGLIEYGHHQKRLKNIEEGKGKGSAVTQILNSPSEKDIFNVSKYQTEARTFHNKERDNRVRKKNEELYYRLESIQKRKMEADGSKALAGKLKNYHNEVQKKEQEKIYKENMKLIQLLLSVESDLSAKKMKEDYKKAVYYRKLSQRSTKPWRKNLSNSPKGERQSTLSQRKSQSPKRSEEESKAVTKKSQAPANEQDTKKRK